MNKIIIPILGLIILAVGAFCLYHGFTKKNPDKKEDIAKTKKNYKIAGGVMLGVGGLMLIVGIYLVKRKSTGTTELAESIILEQDPARFHAKCDQLFGAAGGGIASDWSRMKAEKPIKEQETMCGNYARVLMNQRK